MKVISLSALRPQSGKDTFADIIEGFTKGTVNIKRIAFADALRREVLHEIAPSGFIYEVLEQVIVSSEKDVERVEFSVDHLLKHSYEATPYLKFLINHVGCRFASLCKPRSLRWHLQTYGNDFVKNHLKDTYRWVNFVETRLEKFSENGDVDLVIVTDTRSPEEFKFMESIGAIKVCIVRQDSGTSNTPSTYGHKVESYAAGYDNFDYILTNQFTDGGKGRYVNDVIDLYKGLN